MRQTSVKLVSDGIDQQSEGWNKRVEADPEGKLAPEDNVVPNTRLPLNKATARGMARAATKHHVGGKGDDRAVAGDTITLVLTSS